MWRQLFDSIVQFIFLFFSTPNKKHVEWKNELELKMNMIE